MRRFRKPKNAGQYCTGGSISVLCTVIINLSPSERRHCYEYAEKWMTVDGGRHYNRRESTSTKKRVTDQCIGKAGEVAVSKFLQGEGLRVTGPDFEVYTPAGKSWKQDLVVHFDDHDENPHVKSQSLSAVKIYGIVGWVFQYADDYGNAEGSHRDWHIFGSGYPVQLNGNDLCQVPEGVNGDEKIFCCSVRDDISQVCLRAHVSLRALYAHALFRLPEKDDIKLSKRVIHFSALRRVTDPEIEISGQQW